MSGTPVPSDQASSGQRTGVGGEGDVHPWRFWITDGPAVSPYLAQAPVAAELDSPVHGSVM
jgi:DNA-3-methyladenine glycosylase